MKYTYNDIWNTNNKKDETEASIIRVIRPGADDYDEIHDVIHTSSTPEYFEKTCNDILNNDLLFDEFTKLYIDKVNESILKGKNISSKAYDIYNFLRST